jgi:hypothetical protein
MSKKIIDGETWTKMDIMPTEVMMKEFNLSRKMVESMLYQMEYNRPDIMVIDGEYYVLDT